MALHRYVLTNGGKHIAEQRRGLFHWRTLRYLDTDLRKEEAVMNALATKFEAAAKRRLDAADQLELIRNEIDKATLEVNGEGVSFEVSSGFGGWLGSFFKKPLGPEPDGAWKKFYDLLKSEGKLKSTVQKLLFKPKTVTVGETIHKIVPQNNNQQKKQRSQQNNQHNQNQ